MEFKVAKNSLIKLAANNNDINVLDEFLSGSTALAISYDEPVAPARVIKEFKKENDLPNVKSILFEGELISGDEFDRIADMPSKEQLLSTLILLLNSPLQKLASMLSSPVQNTLSVLANLKDNKSK